MNKWRRKQSLLEALITRAKKPTNDPGSTTMAINHQRYVEERDGVLAGQELELCVP